MIKTLKAASAYFAIVFAVGFVLGTIRVPFVVPYLGERYAELIELPFMLVAIIFAARWTVVRFKLKVGSALFCGLIAAGLLLSIEFSVVLWLRGLDFSEYLESRDPIAAGSYFASVAIFAIIPAAFAYRRGVK